jgi:hypothetical protein
LYEVVDLSADAKRDSNYLILRSTQDDSRARLQRF